MIKFNQEIFEYIKENKFSSGLNVEIKNLFPDQKRTELIKKICENKKIIHVGCVDHLPLIEEKISKNIWMHKIITDTSTKTIGIDINEEGINFLRDKLNYTNVYKSNILEETIPEIQSEKWDYMILGEILEHVDNPIQFLTIIKKKYENIVDKIVITVPNIMVKNRYNFMLKNCSEYINSDHRFWFTPYTLTKVMYQAGFLDINLDFSERSPLTQAELIIRKIKKFAGSKMEYPFYYFNSIIGIAKFNT